MSKKVTYLVWVALLSVAVTCLFFARYSLKNVVIVAGLDFQASTPFTDTISICPPDTSVGDRFICISRLLEKTVTEVDALENKIMLQAPIRLREVTSKNNGPMSWEYGGENFLRSLPEAISEPQKSKSQYINSVCGLAGMNIFGSTGMDIERDACKYYYTEQYLKVLKNIEGGLNREG